MPRGRRLPVRGTVAFLAVLDSITVAGAASDWLDSVTDFPFNRRHGLRRHLRVRVS